MKQQHRVGLGRSLKNEPSRIGSQHLPNAGTRVVEMRLERGDDLSSSRKTQAWGIPSRSFMIWVMSFVYMTLQE